jgi:predicted amidohydrolase
MSQQQNLKVGLLQADLHWEDKEANLEMVSESVNRLPHKPHLVVLPEMFSTGFTMNAPELAEPNQGRTLSFLCELSKNSGIAFCGSFVAEHSGKFVNRFFWIQEGQLTGTYDKRHLFRMAEENNVYTRGKDDIRIEAFGWNIMPRICYDLRFPVWCRSHDADLQIYVANWPKPRVAAWDKLLMARAIENQCYVVGVNRVGVDGNEIAYSGHSIVIDPKGEPLTEVGYENEGWVVATMNLNVLKDFREKFPVAMDADKFKILD